MCDALQLRLEPGQLPWLLEALEELRAAHEQALVEAAAARATLPASERTEAAEEIGRHRVELALLRGVRDRIGYEPHGGAVVCGPAPLLSAIVFAATRVAAEGLVELVGGRGAAHDAVAARRLSDVAAATRSWAQTLLALRQLEWFTFEVEPPPELAGGVA